MNSDTRLVLSIESIRDGSVGPDTGEIWFVLDGVAFPQEGWNDFVVVVLCAWTSALVRIVRGASTHERVSFFEGPYSVELTKSEDGSLLIEGRGGDHGGVRARGSAACEEIGRETLKHARGLLNSCTRRGRMTRDAEALRWEMAALDEAMKILVR